MLPRFCRERAIGCDTRVAGEDLLWLLVARSASTDTDGRDRMPRGRVVEGCLSIMDHNHGPRWSEPLAPFAVVLDAAGADTPVVLQAAWDANWATVIFHQEWVRLNADRISGQLLLLCRREEEIRTLLHEPLG